MQTVEIIEGVTLTATAATAEYALRTVAAWAEGDLEGWADLMEWAYPTEVWD